MLWRILDDRVPVRTPAPQTHSRGGMCSRQGTGRAVLGWLVDRACDAREEGMAAEVDSDYLPAPISRQNLKYWSLSNSQSDDPTTLTQ
jgi:hypothetical protein